MKSYGLFLMKPIVKVIVCLVAALLLAFGIYGTINTSLEFDYKISGASNSPYVQWIKTLESYFDFGVFPMDVVLDKPNVNYTDTDVQMQFLKLDAVAARVPELNAGITYNWMRAYIQYCKQQNISSTDNFNKNLQVFLNHHNKDYKTDIVFNSWGDISASRVHFFTKDKASWSFRKDALVNLRDELKNDLDLPFYPVSFSFIYLSHLVVIVKATLSNVAICCGVILVLTLPFVGRPTISLLLLLSFLCFMLELLGVMMVWDLTLNSVTMIVTVMAIGFTVDYNCHITHGYLSSRKETPNLRMVDAMTTMGISVLKGGFSTLIGVLVLSISDSKLFRLFFKMMFSIVTLGLLHGMVILPVLLTLLVKSPNIDVDDNEDSNEFHRNGVARDSKKELLKSSENGTEQVDDKVTAL